LQADIVADLIRANVAVHAFNQRDVEGIFDMIRTLGALVGAPEKAEALADSLAARVEAVRQRAAALPRHPRVYFEEWDQPMISAIRWVSELVAIAGGEDVFSDLSHSHAAAGRVIADPGKVIEKRPDIILGSWCGKKFRPERVAARAGWHEIPAVKEQQLHEIKSAEILQPGPAALTDGVRRIHAILANWAGQRPA